MNYSEPVRRLPNEHLKAFSRHLDLVLSKRPLLDVRASGEFAKGHMPHSCNLPILTDEERHQVGKTYKHEGAERAIQLGHALVSGDVKDARVAGWLEFVETHEQAMVMCWRGGQRSAIAQSWIAQAGRDVDRVPGGFKALRQLALLLLQSAEHDTREWLVVGGRTGTQKTVIITQLPNGIDLEGLANHRGSAFGAHETAQPAPATFENMLATRYATLAAAELVLEDESRAIGRLAVPEAVHQRMQTAPLVIVEADLEQRVAHIEQEYVSEPLQSGTTREALENRYGDAMARISKRLGGSRYAELKALLHAAFEGKASHAAWIGRLLADYYDPMYDYQLQHKEERILYRGNRDEVTAFLRSRTS